MTTAPPLRRLAPAVTVAACYGAAVLLWFAFGRSVIPGRWLAVHLFTLGVLSNVVLALSDHFARTLLHSRSGHGPATRLVLLNGGVALVLAGLPTGWAVLLATGATVATAAVLWQYLDLRRMRRSALGSRFAFVVRGYERACGAFVHGALIGLLLGVGVLDGRWYGAARLAHLHVNLLGWGGLTLLATIVFFGPTMLRRRIEPGAEDGAAQALQWASAGLTVATIALLLTGAEAPVSTWARLLAGAGLAVYAAATTSIWLAVGRTAARAPASLERVLITAVGVWFVAVTWADAVVVAAGAWQYLDALGTALVLGVLLQAIIVALTYLGPMLRGATAADRGALRSRLQRLARSKAAALNGGIVLVLVATAGAVGAVPAAATVGWLLIAVVAVVSLSPLIATRAR